MVDKRPHVFDESGARRIVRAVEHIENTPDLILPGHSRPNQVWPVQGKMLGDLAAGLEFSANPPTADMQVYHPDPDPANNGQLIDSGYSVTITNRDPEVTKSTDDWCRAIFLNGEWQPHRLAGEQDPACQSSPTTRLMPNLYIRLKTLNYWRSFTNAQFGYDVTGWSPTRSMGAYYDRMEQCNSRHGTPLDRTDFNLLHNVVTSVNGGGALPLGSDITVVATENDGSNAQNITATWDGDWTSPRWKITSSTIIDGVELQGYIAHVHPPSDNHKLRWFYDNPSDNPNPSATPQDGTSGSEFYDPSSIDWCARTASYLFGVGGPRATVTWAKQNPRKWWWNPGGGGSLVDVSNGTHDGNSYWIPSGGAITEHGSTGFAAGTKVDQVYNDNEDREDRLSFLSPATGAAGVDWEEDNYPAMDVEMPDMTWAGAGSAEYWDDNGTSWEYDRPTANWSPQTGWNWTGRIYFYDTGGGLSAWEVVLELHLQSTSGVPTNRYWIFTETIDFSTHFEDQIQATADFTLTNDTGHPDDDGYGTGAYTATGFGSGKPADYSFTMPTSFDINFEYRFLR